MTSPKILNPELLEQFLLTAASATAVEHLCELHNVKFGGGIYNVAVVIWLMIYQRINSKRTLSSAVQFFARHVLQWQKQRRAGKRVREGRISTSTGGYCQARSNLPTLVANSVCDHIFEQLQSQMRIQAPDVPRPIFVIDGTTLRLAHEAELKKAFPPGHNQHGENHWPTLLLVTFHDVYTGLAMRPSWGPMYGKKATSEQELARQALQRLPADALVLADINFGIFAFAYAVQETNRPMLLRLSAARAQKVLQGEPLRPGKRRRVVWEPSRWDLKAHPTLPQGAVLNGWVVACRNPARKQEMLYFFTTLDLKPTRIMALYKLRWNVETDLRSLKRTVSLHQITSKSEAMVEKELLMAFSAYNLVRAVMYLSASSAGVSPRQLSFSVAQDAVLAAWPYLQRAHAQNKSEFEKELLRLLEVVRQAKLPKRSGKRRYAREIWGRGAHFPFRRPAKRRHSGKKKAGR